jgi:hypothetical protein
MRSTLESTLPMVGRRVRAARRLRNSSSSTQTTAGGSSCPICLQARKLDKDALLANAELGGATPLWNWIGHGATVFSYCETRRGNGC